MPEPYKCVSEGLQGSLMAIILQSDSLDSLWQVLPRLLRLPAKASSSWKYAIHSTSCAGPT